MSRLYVLASIFALVSGVRDDKYTGFVDEVVALAAEVYNENFQTTVIGDCDFGYKQRGQTPKERAEDLCPRNMGNGCTMAQMFLGEPAECGGTHTKRKDGAQSYADLWRDGWPGLSLARQVQYKKLTNKGIRDAGKVVLKSARELAKTGDGLYGVGVCTTLAAAGQTAIADKMEADKSKWQGTKIKFMREEYDGMDDNGHEYLIIENAEGTNSVLVDYWYAALEGDTAANIGDLDALAVEDSETSKWRRSHMVVAEDGPEDNKKERIYVVGS